MNKFKETHKLPKSDSRINRNLNGPIESREIESVIKKTHTKLSKKKNPGPDGFTGEFYPMLQEVTPILHQ